MEGLKPLLFKTLAQRRGSQEKTEGYLLTLEKHFDVERAVGVLKKTRKVSKIEQNGRHGVCNFVL
jgi:hypothetical protein